MSSDWVEEEWTIKGKRTRIRTWPPHPHTPVQGLIIYTHGLMCPMVVEEAWPALHEFMNQCHGPCHGSPSPQDADATGTGTGALPWRVIRYDARGQGHSEEAEDAQGESWAALGEEIVALYHMSQEKGMGATRLILGGLSMGVGASLHAFTHLSTLVEAMFFIMPPTAWDTRQGKRQEYTQAALWTREHGVGAYAQRVARSFQNIPLWNGPLGEALVSHLKETSPERLDKLLCAAGESDFPSYERMVDLWNACPIPLDLYVLPRTSEYIETS